MTPAGFEVLAGSHHRGILEVDVPVCGAIKLESDRHSTIVETVSRIPGHIRVGAKARSDNENVRIVCGRERGVDIFRSERVR